MNRDFNVVIERDSEGYYVASVPGLAGCHTQAKSLDVLMERTREAIELCLEVEQDQTESLNFVGIQLLANCDCVAGNLRIEGVPDAVIEAPDTECF